MCVNSVSIYTLYRSLTIYQIDDELLKKQQAAYSVAGVDEEYETPEKADLTVDLTKESVPEIVTSKSSSICGFEVVG